MFSFKIKRWVMFSFKIKRWVMFSFKIKRWVMFSFKIKRCRYICFVMALCICCWCHCRYIKKHSLKKSHSQLTHLFRFCNNINDSLSCTKLSYSEFVKRGYTYLLTCLDILYKKWSTSLESTTKLIFTTITHDTNLVRLFGGNLIIKWKWINNGKGNIFKYCSVKLTSIEDSFKKMQDSTPIQIIYVMIQILLFLVLMTRLQIIQYRNSTPPPNIATTTNHAA